MLERLLGIIVPVFLIIALGWAFARTEALYLSMGLHAGWVFTLQSFSFLTIPNAGVSGRWLGAVALTENVATWPVLVGTFFLVAWLCRNKLDPLPQ
jgi:hypothetical protein